MGQLIAVPKEPVQQSEWSPTKNPTLLIIGKDMAKQHWSIWALQDVKNLLLTSCSVFMKALKQGSHAEMP